MNRVFNKLCRIKQSYECHSMNTYTLTLTCTKNSKKINTNMDTQTKNTLILIHEKKQEELNEIGFSKLSIKSFNFNVAKNQFLL